MIRKARETQIEEDQDYEELDDDEKNAYKEVVTKRAILKLQHKLKKHKRDYMHRMDLNEVKETLKEKKIPTEKFEQRLPTLKRKARKLKDVLNEVLMENEDKDDDDQIKDENEEQK